MGFLAPVAKIAGSTLLGGVVDKVFGGKDTSAGQVGTASGMLPGQEQILNLLLQQMSGQVGKGIEPYGGKMYAGASPLETKGFDLTSMLLSPTGLPSILQNVMKPYDKAEDTEYWEKAMVDPAMKKWESEIIPKIQEKYIAADALDSGASRRAIARSGQELTSNLGSLLSSILFQGKQAHTGRQMEAIPAAGQMLNMATGMGGLQRELSQQGLTEQYQKWQTSQPWANPWLTYLNTALGKYAEPIIQQGGYQKGLLDYASPIVSAFAGSPQGASKISGALDWLFKK